MDLLKDLVSQVKAAEEEKKRKALAALASDEQQAQDEATPPTVPKYMRRGDLERLEEEAKKREKAARLQAMRAGSSSDGGMDGMGRSSSPGCLLNPASSTPPPPNAKSSSSYRKDRFGKRRHENEDDTIAEIRPEEVVQRLRARGQPIRLFGESDVARMKRMRQVEAEAEEGKGQRNEYAKQLARTEAGLELEMLLRQQQQHRGEGHSFGDGRGTTMRGESPRSVNDASGSSGSGGGGSSEFGDAGSPAASSDTPGGKKRKLRSLYKPEYDVSELDSPLLATNPDKCFVLVYVSLRRMLDAWEDQLQERPDSVKRSTAGMHEYTKFRQTKDNLKPFFKLLQRKSVETDVMERIADILHYVHRLEYIKAYDAYLQLSIGKAPWPIGVTMVGIHERSAREKIFSNQVAHVLNDEIQRKWIQSVKRLMTWMQQRYPPADRTKMVG